MRTWLTRMRWTRPGGRSFRRLRARSPPYQAERLRRPRTPLSLTLPLRTGGGQTVRPRRTAIRRAETAPAPRRPPVAAATTGTPGRPSPPRPHPPPSRARPSRAPGSWRSAAAQRALTGKRVRRLIEDYREMGHLSAPRWTRWASTSGAAEPLRLADYGLAEQDLDGAGRGRGDRPGRAGARCAS